LQTSAGRPFEAVRGPEYDGSIALSLVTGPAHAGKVALLLERYLASLDAGREPVLIVPNRSDVDRVERDLLTRTSALLGGTIGTFDDLFAAIARDGGSSRPHATDAQRALLVRGVVAKTPLNGLSRSARTAGFGEALAGAISELESSFVEPDAVPSALGSLYSAYRGELDRLALGDADGLRRQAAERVAGDFSGWDGRPVFAYGFEDLTGTEWRLLEALAARAEVVVSLPYEPGRPAFASLERSAGDLASLATELESLRPRSHEFRPPALAHVERALFSDAAMPAPPPLDGAVRWLEGAGSRGTMELVGEEILALIRDGAEPDTIAVVCPSLDRVRRPLEIAFATLGVPCAFEGWVRLGSTAFGHALLALLRYEWSSRDRPRLFAHLRSPYSGLARTHVDFLEGRLRGRAVGADRVEEALVELRGAAIPPLERLRAGDDPLAAVRALAGAMARAAHGLEAPPVFDAARDDLRAFESVSRLLDELERWRTLGGSVGRDEVLSALERTEVRAARPDEPGRVAVLDLLRARTRAYEIVFVLGLEEGTLPRRGAPSPFLDDDLRRALDDGADARLVRPDAVGRERFLFYAACTRAWRRLVLVREAATDEGSPRQPSPFWDETRALFEPDDVAHATRRRPLSALTWPLEAAPSDRERARALAVLASSERDEATALARANGWDRRLERALSAFDRPTALTHPVVLEELERRMVFGVTELELFADCSSIWFVERLLSPRTIDARLDPRLRGSVAHTALFRYFSGLPKHLGVERVEPEQLDAALAFLDECLSEALEGVYLELTDVERRELEGSLRRDLEALVREEAERGSPLVPRRFEVSFGSERSAPELQRGLELDGFALSGKIDRIDVDPFSARGIVQDYKSGSTAHSAARIESELKLQIPLYMLVLRDLVGIEPLGGVYRALAGKREARGLLRATARADGVPGYAENDYLDEDAFWRQVELARERANGIVARLRAGDVRHDPKGGSCPDWCELWSMCRVRRS
jgi:RecB family exonuclease